MPNKIKRATTKEKRNDSQADTLIDLAQGMGIKLFHDAQEPFARIPINGHKEIWRLNDSRFRWWLARLMKQAKGKVPYRDALVTARDQMSGVAIFDGPKHELHNRVALDGNAMWYDLSDEQWRAVGITTEGWEVVDDPPILFRRYAHQKPQVTPQRSDTPKQTLNRLFDYINVREEDKLLLLCYIISCFIPDIPHPIPVLHGEAGSGKTVMLKVVRALIDPSQTDTLSLGYKAIELIQRLDHNWAPYFDNVSTLSNWQQDLLCRACTGEGFSKRQLYSDDEDVIYAFRRCVALNGVNVATTRPDLMDRAILFQLGHIPAKKRRLERELWAEFEGQKPLFLGAIFSTLSKAMAFYGDEAIARAKFFRMADFAAWGWAIAETMGQGEEFLDAYGKDVKNRATTALEFHPLGVAIMAFMTDRNKWKGAPSTLYSELKEIAETEKIDTTEKPWPGSVSWLGRRLREVKPALRQVGIDIVEDDRDEAGNRIIQLERRF